MLETAVLRTIFYGICDTFRHLEIFSNHTFLTSSVEIVCVCVCVFYSSKIIESLKTLMINQHIRMISEGSCDTEDWSNDAENSALHHRDIK